MKRLKLKKNQQNHKVALSIRGRTQLWTQDLFIALLLALGLHLSFLLLFEIDLGQFSILPLDSSKITVFGDLTKEGTFTTAESSENRRTLSFSYAGLARKNEPELPAAFTEFSPSSFIQEPSQPYLSNSWIAYEEDQKKPLIGHFNFSHGFNTNESDLASLKSETCCKGKLEFQASTETGQVIWIRWIASTGQSKLDKEIESLLKKQRFKIHSKTLFAHGTLEVGFGQ